MKAPKIKIIQIEYHRNGVGGKPFYAVLFKHAPEGRKQMNFLASVFDEQGSISVICLDMIEEHGVTFAENSWRGDYFETVLIDAIKKEKGYFFD